MIGGIILFVVSLVILLSLSVQKEKKEAPEKNMALKVIYTFLVGIFVAVFVGVGIAAFYPEPKSPEYPSIMKYGCVDINKENGLTAEDKAKIEKYDQEQKDYQAQSQKYNRNVSVMALVASIIIVIASLTLFKKILFIADGVLLGGVLTLLYSVIRGFGTEDNMFRFIVVSIGLFVSLFLGYVKFIHPAETANK